MQRASLLLGASLALTSSASACPACSLGQGMETLVYIMGFMTIPYVIVTGVLYWMRKLTLLERDI
ncbi:MAG: hypothetical protein ACI835_001207 [Planctomycetota bacterium]|jgi:hypothetical protein